MFSFCDILFFTDKMQVMQRDTDCILQFSEAFTSTTSVVFH